MNENYKWVRAVNDFLTGKLLSRGDVRYFQPMFDPVQTHALYSITKDELDKHKKLLKEIGASRFRVVKCFQSNFIILCFSAKKIKLPQ